MTPSLFNIITVKLIHVLHMDIIINTRSREDKLHSNGDVESTAFKEPGLRSGVSHHWKDGGLIQILSLWEGFPH